jgi:hypothetical protein
MVIRAFPDMAFQRCFLVRFFIEAFFVPIAMLMIDQVGLNVLP